MVLETAVEDNKPISIDSGEEVGDYLKPRH